MSCGTTMQAAISTVAHSPLDRVVSTLPISGSIAALARWNSEHAAGENEQRRLAQDGADRRRRVLGRVGGPGRHGRAPDRLRRGRMRPSASSAGISSAAVTKNTAARREQISDRAHPGGGDAIADRGKARVAPEPLADRRVADEPEAHRHDAGTQHATCRRVHARPRPRPCRKHRQQRIGERRGRDPHQRNGRRPAAPYAPQSTSAPPGICRISAMMPLIESTSPMSVCVHFCEVR